RKSLSPPVPKPLVSPIQPKSKTPPIVHSGSPSHAALAAMGPMFGIQMKPESSGYSKKLQEPRPKKTSQKSPRSSNNNSLLDLSSSPTGPMSAATTAATTSPSAMDKAKEQAAAMNMLMMNSNAQKQIHMNNYLTELAKLNNQNMMMPQMVGLQPNPVFNQMMQALYLQQYCRMSKASSDNLDK
ncbi:posterior sex combs protein, partial [Culex quinquefasciatus]